MAKYDIERFCDDLKTIVSTYLNAKLLVIDAEKNDGITLAPVNSSAYAFQEMNNEIANYDPYILYSIEGIESVPDGPYVSKTPQVHFILCLADTGQDGTTSIAKRMLRYQRALEEVIQEHWTENNNAVKLSISSMAPEFFRLMNSPHPFRAVGIAVSGSIG